MQANFNALAPVLDINATFNRSTGFSAFRHFRGYEPDTPLTTLTGTAGLPGDVSTEQFAHLVSQTQLLAATSSSTSQIIAARDRDAARGPPVALAAGDYVLVWYPPLNKMQEAYRGPFIVDSKRTDSWYSIRRLVDKDNTAAVPFQVHVSRLRKFNNSRVTDAQLLSRGLDDDFCIVKAITGHHRLPDGSYEFDVLWEGGDISRSSPETLSKITIFRDYITAHKIAIKLPVSNIKRK